MLSIDHHRLSADDPRIVSGAVLVIGGSGGAEPPGPILKFAEKPTKEPSIIATPTIPSPSPSLDTLSQSAVTSGGTPASPVNS
jgi:hypothetical protein